MAWAHSWKARSFAMCQSSEKGLHSGIQTIIDLMQELAIDVLKLRIILLLACKVFLASNTPGHFSPLRRRITCQLYKPRHFPCMNSRVAASCWEISSLIFLHSSIPDHTFPKGMQLEPVCIPSTTKSITIDHLLYEAISLIPPS